ncbi:MAG: methyltransferase domain-containing protein, partial [Planctomycetota bacterium]
SVAIAQVYGTALGGRCAARPELPEQVLPLETRLAVLPCRGGDAFLRCLFEPLGWEVEATPHTLDPAFPEWGASPYFTVTLRGRARLQDLLSHLYVLIPVLDNEKHYWVGQDELDKLLRHGEGWLAGHPARETIVLRYLKHQRGLARAALARLAEGDQPDPDAELEARAEEEVALEASVAGWEGEAPAEPTGDAVKDTGARASASNSSAGASPSHPSTAAERGPTLNSQRLGTVLAVLKGSGARSVLDLGCGDGKLLRALLDEKQFERVVGLDVAHRVLEIAADRLRLERMPAAKRQRLELLHGSLTYRDARLAGCDAAAVIEVIEHLDPPRLAAFERVLFEFARPRTVVVTTPNREYNVLFPTLPAGRLRHRDHRFEWTRAEFRAWAERVAARFGYTARFLPVGPEDPAAGAPTQMGVFAVGSDHP